MELYSFIDTVKEDCPRCGVIDGMEYTYSLTAFDIVALLRQLY